MLDRIAICEFSTFRWTLSEDLVRYSTYGFDGIGVWRRKVDDIGLASAVDLIHEHQADVSSIQWAGCFTGCDGRSFDDCLDDSYNAIRLAAMVNADCLIVHPGMRNGHTTRHAQRLLRSGMDLLVEYAADHEVRLALEPMMSPGAKNWTFLESWNQCLEVVDRYSPRQVGLVLDLYHVGLNAIVEEALPQLSQRIALVQLSDRSLQVEQDESRCLLGQGVVPIKRWIDRLQQAGYSGKYEVELHGSGIAPMCHFELLDQVCSFFEKPGERPSRTNGSKEIRM